jgi:hypothetical protein
VLFEKRFWPLIADGSLRLTFRRWRQRQVSAGGRYRTPGGMIEVDAVTVVGESAVSDDEARRSGYPSSAALLAGLPVRPGAPLYRVEFHVVDIPDARSELAADDSLTDDQVGDITRRLARMDGASAHGPWTLATLRAIAARPATRAGDLAESFGRERLAFKAEVRKLKALGLTISLERGYRLSPRGEAYLGRRGSD